MRIAKLLFVAMGLSVTLLTGCNTPNPYTGDPKTGAPNKGTILGVLSGSGATVSAMTHNLLGNAYYQQNAELRKTLENTGVQIEQNGNITQLVMASDASFTTGKATIQPNYDAILDSVAIVLKKYNNTNVYVFGFTDNIGSPTSNLHLSSERAKNVGNYLIAQGVNANRVYTAGKGESNPVASNTTTQGRAMNRRIVITLNPSKPRTLF